MFPGNWLIFALSASMAFASCALMALGYFTTNMRQAAYVCIFYGGILFLPVFAGVMAVHLILNFTTKLFKSLPRMWSGLYLLVPLLLLLIGVNYAYRQRDKEVAFKSFFARDWPKGGVLAYGYEKMVLGDGTYVLVFRISREQLMPLLKGQDYVPVEMDSRPDTWRLELCNDAIRKLTRSPVQVYAQDECYEKHTARNSSRVFFNPGNNFAVFIGLGRY